MQRRHFLQLLAPSLVMAETASQSQGRGSQKKGWAGGDAAAHQLFGAHWYYNWGTGGSGGAQIEFVPMIKGAQALAGKAVEQVRRASMKHLLGFNEPERESQGNLSVEEALKHWPALQAVAEEKSIPLGSPAPSSDKKGVEWLEAFMKEAKKRKLRVDFIAMHWYRSRDAGDFQNFLKGLSRAHRLPVWVTEFNGWSGGEPENRSFLGKVLRFMERDSDIERYAYFEPGKGKPHSLYLADGSLSKMGELYRDAGK